MINYELNICFGNYNAVNKSEKLKRALSKLYVKCSLSKILKIDFWFSSFSPVDKVSK